MSMMGFRMKLDPLKIVTEGDIDEIHKGTLDVLENTGLRIEHQEALKLYKKSGCKVNISDNRVRIPPGLVEECLCKCPSSFRIKARNSKNDMIVGGNSLYVSLFAGMETIDLDTWEPRKPTRDEFYDAVKVIDALENIHFFSNYTPWFGYEGLPPVMCIPEAFAAVTRNSSKVLKSGYSKDSEIFTIQMAQAVGADAMVSCMASAPLTYYTDAIEALYRALEADFPATILSGGIMGGSVPATIAGATVVNNAELMAGIVLAQLIRPGAKVIVQNYVFPLNMRSGIPAFGSIECSLHNVIFNQYFRRFGVPTYFVNTGPVSSKIPDFQTGSEKTFLGILTALSGAHIMLLCGSLFGELVTHPVQAILDNDLSGMIKRFLQGVNVDEESLALDLIKKVGPIPGHYLDKEHTRVFWKKEHFVPKVSDRQSLQEWVATGKKTALDNAKKRMKEILDTHEPIWLSPGQEEDIKRILEEARRYYKQKDMME